jgi:hypothetical protein
METLGFVGGTGPLGRGLAVRLGQAGHRILVGSRDAGRAGEAAAKVRAKDPEVDVTGTTNLEAAGAEIVFVTVPYEAQRPTLPTLGSVLDGKIVVSCVAAFSFDDHGPCPVKVEAGSAAQECQELLPGARVVGAFQNVSAVKLLRVPDPVEADILLTGDDTGACEAVAELVQRIPGMAPIQAGPLRLSRPVEELTAVLVSVNKRYKAHASIRLTGLARADS